MPDSHTAEDDLEKGSIVSKEEKDLPNPYDEDESDDGKDGVADKTAVQPKLVDEPGEIDPTQEQLKELQRELSDFLALHIAKSLNLQNSLHAPTDPLKLLRKRGSTFERENASFVSPGSTGIIAAHSHEAPLSRLDFGSSRGSPTDAHIAALDKFLGVHMNNLQALQDSMNRGPQQKAMPSKVDVSSHGTPQGGHYTQEFAGLIAASILQAVFIVVFLSLTRSLMVLRNQRIPFDVAMLFSFFSLLFLILSLCLSLWGIMAASWRRLRNEPESQVQINFYLFLSSQLQFCGSVTFVLPFILASFYIFSGIAFPVVLLVFLLVVSMVVMGSVVYRVPISLENVSTIVLSTRHMERPSLRPSWKRNDTRGSSSV
ncbi:hypothetical protein DFP72DRAFT_1066813 [Ephemerocybe angulata]|uniref:Transmembrane protein n=1 Tax=Ephemerocybe angulata TaxID=980116 RepID=A0A8H6M9X2_9AGAR|nr:hypothetical protein DFP72DRAFT_1066813 [Tulosesus angulatus]